MDDKDPIFNCCANPFIFCSDSSMDDKDFRPEGMSPFLPVQIHSMDDKDHIKSNRLPALSGFSIPLWTIRTFFANS